MATPRRTTSFANVFLLLILLSAIFVVSFSEGNVVKDRSNSKNAEVAEKYSHRGQNGVLNRVIRRDQAHPGDVDKLGDSKISRQQHMVQKNEDVDSQKNAGVFENGAPGVHPLKVTPAGEAGQVGQPPHKPAQIKISDSKECAADVKRICAEKVADNNFAILDCLQHDFKSENDISPECQNFIWEYKKNLTTDVRFDSATSEVCNKDLNEIAECNNLPRGQGHVIPCLVENKEQVKDDSCRLFLTKMGSIVFSDYRLVYKFTEKCSEDIKRTGCGRLEAQTDTGGGTNAPHQQGKTLECLSSKLSAKAEGDAKQPAVSKECKHEILRVAELQSDDYHMDRPLFFACRDAREHFCERVKSGQGKVFKCLYKHKFDNGMPAECREQLVRRQKLMQEDYKVNRGFANQCNRDIKKYKCLEGTDVPTYEKGRLAHVLLCLESHVRDGMELQAECVQEMTDMRKSLMSDYSISPEIVKHCSKAITEHCGKLHRNGRTLHCLMNLAKPSFNKDPNGDAHDFPGHLDAECLGALSDLMEEADPGEDYNVDPTLDEACASTVELACKDVKPGEGRVLNCLMEHVGTDKMDSHCEQRLLELQFFIARDFELDYSLYKQCHKDATNFCHAPKEWHDDSQNPQQGPLVFNCLYGIMKKPTADQQLSRSCTFEVRRVMIQRAKRVELHHEIQEACMQDLSQKCSEETNKGEEINCLQDHLEDLQPNCQKIISEFTEDEDAMPELDRILMKACTPMIKRFCKDEMDEDVAAPGDIMDCLIEHKNHMKMDEKCRAGIEHHQLISIKDYRFTHKFKEACKETVVKLCDSVKSKAEVIECLSDMVREDTLKNHQHRVPQKCRQHLRAELLEREEDIELDQDLKSACKLDLRKFCDNVTPGKAQKLECLKKNQDRLTDSCHKHLFKREELEAIDNTIDYKLMSVCKSMIKKYCMRIDPPDILNCLKGVDDIGGFDENCAELIADREVIQNKDYRLNVDLQNACQKDMDKYCHELLKTIDDPEELNGQVLTCLRVKFSQRKLSQDCKNHIAQIIKDSALDYRQDPQLAQACEHEIKSHCIHEVSAEVDPMDHTGAVETCLKSKLAEGKITNKVCQKEIARILAESIADIHVDPLLHRACALDLKHYCADIPMGEGRLMSCMLSSLDNKRVTLKPQCEKMLRERKEMWEHAAKVAPPETFQELTFEIISSPAKSYFLGTIAAVIGVLFFAGLFCGRFTKRVRPEQKNK